MKKAAVLLADGFEEVEAITPIDFLRRAEIEVDVVGVTGKTVTGGHGISVRAGVKPKELVKNVDSYDAVIVPGGVGGAENIAASSETVGFIQNMMASGKLVAAICAAPALVLSPNGILQGKKATCYPGFEEKFTDAEFQAERVVVDGNLITSRGPGTAAEFAVAIIRYLEGDGKADEVHSGTLQK